MPLFRKGRGGEREQSDGAPVGGLLAHYGLVPWWLDTFTEAERTAIEFMYAPLAGGRSPLTAGQCTQVNKSAAEFLVALAHRYEGDTRSTIAQRIHVMVARLTDNNPPGCIYGKPYSNYLPHVQQLIEAGELAEAAPLVGNICNAIESVARVGPGLVETFCPPPAVYWDVAVLYRKQQAYAEEVALLERWVRLFQQTGGDIHGLRGRGAECVDRLAKARTLLARSQQ